MINDSITCELVAKGSAEEMTNNERIGGLAEITIEQVNSDRVSILVGKDKLIDILFSEDGIIAIHKIRHENKWICVDARDLMIKMMSLLQA